MSRSLNPFTNLHNEAGVRIAARRIETWCKGERRELTGYLRWCAHAEPVPCLYRGIVLVAILKGAFMFLSDLCSLA